jgi:hypothetical protein
MSIVPRVGHGRAAPRARNDADVDEGEGQLSGLLRRHVPVFDDSSGEEVVKAITCA